MFENSTIYILKYAFIQRANLVLLSNFELYYFMIIYSSQFSQSLITNINGHFDVKELIIIISQRSYFKIVINV